jgi:hypothetical protein
MQGTSDIFLFFFISFFSTSGQLRVPELAKWQQQHTISVCASVNERTNEHDAFYEQRQ